MTYEHLLYAELKYLCCQYLNCFSDIFDQAKNGKYAYDVLCTVVALKDKSLRASFDKYASIRFDIGIGAGHFDGVEAMRYIRMAMNMFESNQQSVFEHMSLLAVKHLLGHELMLAIQAAGRISTIFEL